MAEWIAVLALIIAAVANVITACALRDIATTIELSRRGDRVR